LKTARSILHKGYVQEGFTESEILLNVWKELYSLEGEPIYLEMKPK